MKSWSWYIFQIPGGYKAQDARNVIQTWYEEVKYRKESDFLYHLSIWVEWYVKVKPNEAKATIINNVSSSR